QPTTAQSLKGRTHNLLRVDRRRARRITARLRESELRHLLNNAPGTPWRGERTRHEAIKARWRKTLTVFMERQTRQQTPRLIRSDPAEQSLFDGWLSLMAWPRNYELEPLEPFFGASFQQVPADY